jgi:hypothetical protein
VFLEKAVAFSALSISTLIDEGGFFLIALIGEKKPLMISLWRSPADRMFGSLFLKIHYSSLFL